MDPFNVYAATEPACVAAECERHRLHLFEGPIQSENIAAALAAALTQAGASQVQVDVELVDLVQKTALGKTPLIKALRDEPSAGA